MKAPTTDRRTALGAIAALPLLLAGAPAPTDFDYALGAYGTAKDAEREIITRSVPAEAWSDGVVANLDQAIDRLIATPSPDAAALATKMNVLLDEYGGEVQSRHFRSLAEDARLLARA